MRRQQLLLPYELVIHECALRIRVSDRAASRAQLAKLLELSEADHITVRVIPFDLDGFARAAVMVACPGARSTPVIHQALGSVPRVEVGCGNRPAHGCHLHAERHRSATS